MSISFFPQKSIYNQIVQSQYLELIENKKLKENLASLYEHLNDRNESANLKLDLFNQEFDLAFIDLVNIASPFVGNGPKVKTCIPPDTSPDTKAGSKVYPDNLVSFAIIAICLDFF